MREVAWNMGALGYDEVEYNKRGRESWYISTPTGIRLLDGGVFRFPVKSVAVIPSGEA